MDELTTVQPNKSEAETLKAITSNIEASQKHYKRLCILCFVGLFVSFFSMPLIGILGGAVYQIEIFPWILIPMPFYPAFIVLLFFVLPKKTSVDNVNKVVNKVKQDGKALLVEFGYLKLRQEVLPLYFEKLISTGNLDGFEIVGDVMIARCDYNMSVEQAKRESAERILNSLDPMEKAKYEAIAKDMGCKENRPTCFCEDCGAPLTGEENFCPKCGIRIKYE